MIAWWHLLWIVPLAFAFGFFVAALLAVSKKPIFDLKWRCINGHILTKAGNAPTCWCGESRGEFVI